MPGNAVECGSCCCKQNARSCIAHVTGLQRIFLECHLATPQWLFKLRRKFSPHASDNRMNPHVWHSPETLFFGSSQALPKPRTMWQLACAGSCRFKCYKHHAMNSVKKLKQIFLGCHLATAKLHGNLSKLANNPLGKQFAFETR